MTDLTIHGLAREYDQRHPDDIPLIVAAKALSDLTPEQKRSLLVRAIGDEVEVVRRERARKIERDAIVSFQPVRYGPPLHRNSKAYRDWLETPEGREHLEREDQERAAKDEREAEWREAPWRAPRNTRIFREWSQTDEGRRHEEARIAAEAEEADRQRLFEEDYPEYSRRYGWGRMQLLIEESNERIRQKARLELTAELLGSSFALGDGRSVTWGAATLHDHQQRMEMLMRHVEGNVQTIQLHELAASVLRESGAGCLNDAEALVA